MAKKQQYFPLSPQSVERAALNYLKRHTSSRANLRRILQNKAARLRMRFGGASSEHTAWIDEVLDRLETSGLLDDQSYAENVIRAQLRRKRSFRHIHGYLQSKGLTRDQITEAMNRAAPEDKRAVITFQNGLALARKRRLGPFRLAAANASDPRKRRRKELGIFARLGFPLDIAFAIIDAESIEDLEERHHELNLSGADSVSDSSGFDQG